MTDRGFQRPPTAQAAVLKEMRRAIIERDIPPGTPVRADEVAKRLGVSRIPVREALKILEAEGQVEYVPHLGFFVPELAADDLLEIYSMRVVLEGLAIRRMTTRIDEAGLARIDRLLSQAASALASGDLAGYAEANRAFHMALIEPAGMPRLTRFMRMLWDSMEPYRPVLFPNDEARARHHAEHLEISEALHAGRSERVIDLLERHRRRVVETLHARLEGDQPPGAG